MELKEYTRILFIGDSITDAGRKEDNDSLGWGYVRIIHDYLQLSYPDKAVEFLNRGIGGDRIIDLENRWQEDVLSLQPDFLSISIGINDVWRQLDHPEMEQVYPERFKEIYEHLLTQVKEKTDAQIIIMEPTIIEEDVNARGNQLLKAYVQVVHEMAQRFDAVVVPTHESFCRYLENEKRKKLTTDGVHMNSLGNMLMAKTWLEAVLR